MGVYNANLLLVTVDNNITIMTCSFCYTGLKSITAFDDIFMVAHAELRAEHYYVNTTGSRATFHHFHCYINENSTQEEVRQNLIRSSNRVKPLLL